MQKFAHDYYKSGLDEGWSETMNEHGEGCCLKCKEKHDGCLCYDCRCKHCKWYFPYATGAIVASRGYCELAERFKTAIEFDILISEWEQDIKGLETCTLDAQTRLV
jgi:hypothetical protein